MKGEEIRKDAYMEEYLRQDGRDIKGIREHKAEFTRVLFPACGRNDHVQRFEKSGFRFVECSFCETLFIDPRPIVDLLAEFYRSAQSIPLCYSKIYPAIGMPEES